MVSSNFCAMVISSTVESFENPVAAFLLNSRFLQISSYAGDNNTEVIAMRRIGHRGMERLVLRREGLVETRRDGKQVFYRISSPAALVVTQTLYQQFSSGEAS